MHFETHAAVYERARPPYPDALWSRIRELGVLQPGARAVDLGAGTGQATGPLLEAGLTVTAIEPGASLAAQLHERYPTATVQICRAEDAALPVDAFELAVAATSIHWMDLGIVLPKVRDALTDSGYLLVWRTAFGDPTVSTPFRERIEAIVAERRGPQRPGPTELETDRWADALTADGLFSVDSIDHFRWSIRLDRQQVSDLFTTFSDWSVDEVSAAADAVADLGGSVTEHYVTSLIALHPGH
jgi:SAM-dependent methyltransferase